MGREQGWGANPSTHHHPSQTFQAQIEVTTLLASDIQLAELLLLRSRQRTETHHPEPRTASYNWHTMEHPSLGETPSKTKDCKSHTMGTVQLLSNTIQNQTLHPTTTYHTLWEHPSLWDTPSKTKDRILRRHITHHGNTHLSFFPLSIYLANTAEHLNSEWHEQYVSYLGSFLI